MTAANSYMAEIAKLRAENEILRAENFALKDHLRIAAGDADTAVLLQRALQMTSTTARLCAALMVSKNGYSTKSDLYAGLYDETVEIGEKIIDVYLVRLRRTLRARGMDVVTVWGGTLFLPPTTKTQLLDLAESAR